MHAASVKPTTARSAGLPRRGCGPDPANGDPAEGSPAEAGSASSRSIFPTCSVKRASCSFADAICSWACASRSSARAIRASWGSTGVGVEFTGVSQRHPKLVVDDPAGSTSRQHSVQSCPKNGRTAANAQNLDQGKPAPKLSADGCAACHRSPRGLAKGRFKFTLYLFLKEHYSSGPDTASELAAYLESVDSDQRGPSRAGAKPQRSSSRPPKPVQGR